MLDLRLLDSFQEALEPEEQCLGDRSTPPMRQGEVGAGLSRAKQELGSTVSLQVTTTTAWVSHLSGGAGVLLYQLSYLWKFVVILDQSQAGLHPVVESEPGCRAGASVVCRPMGG